MNKIFVILGLCLLLLGSVSAYQSNYWVNEYTNQTIYLPMNLTFNTSYTINISTTNTYAGNKNSVFYYIEEFETVNNTEINGSGYWAVDNGGLEPINCIFGETCIRLRFDSSGVRYDINLTGRDYLIHTRYNYDIATDATAYIGVRDNRIFNNNGMIAGIISRQDTNHPFVNNEAIIWANNDSLSQLNFSNKVLIEEDTYRTVDFMRIDGESLRIENERPSLRANISSKPYGINFTPTFTNYNFWYAWLSDTQTSDNMEIDYFYLGTTTDKFNYTCGLYQCNLTALANASNVTLRLPNLYNESALNITISQQQEQVEINESFGEDNGLTYYKEEFLYLYNFSTPENYGFLNKNFSGGLLENGYFNTSKGFFTHDINFNYSSLDGYTISFWLQNYTGNDGQLFTVSNSDSPITQIFGIDIFNNGLRVFSDNDNILTNVSLETDKSYMVSVTYSNNRGVVRVNNDTITNTTTIQFPHQLTYFDTPELAQVRIGSQAGYTIDQFLFSNFAFTKTDHLQFAYWQETNSTPRLQSGLPSNVLLYRPNGDIVTLFDNASLLFNWSESINPLNDSINYSVVSGINSIIQESQNTNVTYNFSDGVWINAQYNVDVSSCNSLGCTEQTFTNAFSVCVNDWVPTISQCTNNTQTTTYTDANNCPEQYNVPQNTTQSCTSPQVVDDGGLFDNDELVFVILVLVIIGGFIVGRQYPIFNLFVVLTLGISVFMVHGMTENVTLTIIMGVGTLLYSLYTAFQMGKF